MGSIIDGAGELHLEICLKGLRDNFMGGAEIVRSDPVASSRETVFEKPCRAMMSRSSNKHDRLYVRAQPSEEGIARLLMLVVLIQGGYSKLDPRPCLRSSFVAKILQRKSSVLELGPQTLTWWLICVRELGILMKLRILLLLSHSG